MWDGGDFSFSDISVATNAEILTEGRGLLSTIGINVAGYSISNMTKGSAPTTEGAVVTSLRTITGFGTTKALGATVGSNIATGVGAVVTEATTSKTNETLDN